MKIAQINAVCGGSTGKICTAIAEKLAAQGDACTIYYALGEDAGENCVRYTDAFSVKTQALRAKVGGCYGFTSRKATERLLAELERFQPEIVQLHNLHSHQVDLELLLSYLTEKKIKVVWTFHDCWAFTGYCVHFDRIGCEKWKTRCQSCPQRREYSFFVDRSTDLFERKKKLLTALDLTIVTPSSWMASLVGQSFLKEKRCVVIPNGIDLGVFCPRESSFRQDHGLEGKKIVLGVAYQWDARKGIADFIELSRRLPDEYRIVLVGTDESVDRNLPASILSIHKTQNQRELAEIYSAADVFVNPTWEDTFPTVNLEALACGTPVVTYRTGGSAECLAPLCGTAVEKGDLEGLEHAVTDLAREGSWSKEACLNRAGEYDKENCYARYLTLYRERIESSFC